MCSSSPDYAIIDLGSNSFHLLVVRKVAGNIQTLARIKRKVRLAAGLDNHNFLSNEAMQRGWQCLRLFSERLRPIPPSQICVVATATLRIARNAQQFVQQAHAILGCPVRIISGEEEAHLIYQGATLTTGGATQRLVIDIGGASTELIAGQGTHANVLFSLPMGCVTGLKRDFHDHTLTEGNFTNAESAARALLLPIVPPLRQQGWQICIGASGTLQALQEIMLAQGMDEHITLEKLYQLRQKVIDCGHLNALKIPGLTLNRAWVFPSGLAILIAIFETLGITSITPAGGALREGLIHNMLTLSPKQDVRVHTIQALQQRYWLDIGQGERVRLLAQHFIQQLTLTWSFDPLSIELLYDACLLHEIGLSIDDKQATKHAQYLIYHSELPGFTPAQKTLLAVLLRNQHGQLDLSSLNQQNTLPSNVVLRLCRLLRLAILFACSHHSPPPSEGVTLQAVDETLYLYLPPHWSYTYPLTAANLQQEKHHQQEVHWNLQLKE